MKNSLFISILITIANLANAQGIQFEDKLTWEEVKTKAETEKKAIFLDFYTTWCGPCKWMDENVYSQEEVGNYINKYYVSVRVQMDITSKDNDFVKSWYETSKKMATEYKVAAYPTLLFANSKGVPSFKMDQLLKPETFLKAARMALDPNEGFVGKLKQYQSGKTDVGFILDLIMHAQELGLNEQANQIGRQYVATLKDYELFTPDNLMILFKTTSSSRDRGFSIFQNQALRVYRVAPLLSPPYSKSLIDNIIRKENIEPFLKDHQGKPNWAIIKANLKKWGKRGEMLLSKEEYAVAGVDSERIFDSKIKPLINQNAGWTETLDKIKALNLGKGEEILVGKAIINYMNRTMQRVEIAYNKFLPAALYYESKFPIMVNSQGLNNWAWFSFLKTDSKPYLNKAINWSRKSIELDPSNRNMDTYANLLHKLGRTKEAIEIEEKILANDPNNSEFKDTLEKMKKGEPTWNRAF